MISIDDKRVCETDGDIPTLPDRIEELYLDVETTNSTRTRLLRESGAFFPYAGDRICGVAVTWDDNPTAWYLPIRHANRSKNLSLKAVLRFVQDAISRSKRWVNQNVKFDAHFLAVDGVTINCGELVDTATLSKLLDSDRLNHSLKPICRDWLGLEMKEELAIKRWLKEAKTDDYARVPADILGEYACQDVLACRSLWKWALERLPEESKKLWEIEKKMTYVLFDMEREGVHVDKKACAVEGYRSLKRMIEAAQLVKDEVGVDLVDSSDCFYEILVTQLGLPVLKRTGPGGFTGNPSFDKEALAQYLGHPDVLYDERKTKILKAMYSYRIEETFKGLYVDSFTEKMDDEGLIHPSYNQLVRTGRMSCSDPNAQQLSPRAKELIVPKKDEAFFCQDASQIEFRLIVHYVQNPKALAAYAADPWTDFHQWVADLCETARKPAKTLNFTMAYGAGRKTTTKKLSLDKDVMARMTAVVDEEIAAKKLDESMRSRRYASLCEAAADKVYERYHQEFPEIRDISERARILTMQRGYIKNAYGRRRHLPAQAAHKAFNSMVQGLAMDVIKERMVALAPRFNSWSRRIGLKLAINVHDELLERLPAEADEDPVVGDNIVKILEDVQLPLRVPIKWVGGSSTENWRKAKAE